MNRLKTLVIGLFSLLAVSACNNETDPPRPVESEQFFIEEAQLGFESYSFDSGREFLQARIEDGDGLVFVYNENRLIDLSDRGILTMKGESAIPDNIIMVEVPGDVSQYSLTLSGLEADERPDIALYRDVFDGVFIESLTFTATKINDEEWSVTFSADLSDNGNPFFTISHSGIYRKALID